MLLTEWPEFKALEPAALESFVNEKRIIDARNVLDATSWEQAGWHFTALGQYFEPTASR